MGQITPTERKLIDDAIAKGQVTRLDASQSTKRDKVEARRKDVLRLHNQGNTAEAMAKALQVSTATIAMDRKALGLVGKRGPRSKGDQAAEKKAERSKQKAALVADRRRFKHTPVPFGSPAITVDASMQGTRYPDRVFEPDGAELVLKDGCNNSKIGGDVLVGRLKGAYIATLTLEERATCPTSCGHWRTCYGNSMQYARRWKGGPALEAQIRHEVEDACAKNDHVLIRLHVLGDFYSFKYLCLWADLLDTHENLTVFGFTAWPLGTRIGDGIAKLRTVYPSRFMIRTSGASGAWGSFTVDFPTERKTIGDAIVCPEQRDAMNGAPKGIHCGNCAACWSTDRPIVFVEH